MGRDGPTFRDKGTEVLSLSWDKGTTGQAQNLAKGLEGPEQPVKIQDGIWDFDSLSLPVQRDKTGESRRGCSKAGKGRIKNRKGHSNTGKYVLKQANEVLNEVLQQEILSFFLKILI